MLINVLIHKKKGDTLGECCLPVLGNAEEIELDQLTLFHNLLLCVAASPALKFAAVMTIV